jgi:Fibronectin type III domain
MMVRRFHELLYNISFSVPPVPHNFSLLSKLSDGLNIGWRKPYPPNGILTGYKLKYRPITRVEYTVVDVDADALGYNLTGLQPFTAYVFQVMTVN